MYSVAKCLSDVAVVRLKTGLAPGGQVAKIAGLAENPALHRQTMLHRYPAEFRHAPWIPCGILPCRMDTPQSSARPHGYPVAFCHTPWIWIPRGVSPGSHSSHKREPMVNCFATILTPAYRSI